jgi:hypothetical protein
MRRSLPYLAAALALSALLVVTLTLAIAGKDLRTTNTDVSSVEVDGMDCEADDRAKREIPDCGRKVGGKYVEWSWVKAGKKTPPPGWLPRHESTASTTKPVPRTSTRTATSGGTNLLDGRSRRTTTKQDDSGTTRKNNNTTRGR